MNETIALVSGLLGLGVAMLLVRIRAVEQRLNRLSRLDAKAFVDEVRRRRAVTVAGPRSSAAG